MHRPKALPSHVRSISLCLITIVSVTIIAFIAIPVIAQSPTQAAKTKTETTVSVKAEPLSGAELWAMNCNRCHMARNPGEFTAAQWRTIFRHMRIRANLPAAQAKELQKYLESGAGK